MTTQADTISCQNCSADLKYDPSSQSMKCKNCGSINEISLEENTSFLNENSFDEFENEMLADQVETKVVQCKNCSAQFDVRTEEQTADCAFCATPYVMDQLQTIQMHKPSAVLPFAIADRQARDHFKEWIDGLWFAPNDLKKYASTVGKLQGIYYPYWTYDCETDTTYTGKRGDYYYETETYTTTNDEGESVQKTRRVRRTRWSYASGRVHNSFDDILVPAHGSLDREILDELEPWKLQDLKPYDEQFLQGFKVLNYNVTMRQGFQEFATPKINDAVDSTIRSDIGGDEQRINHTNMDMSDQTFKHLLLPVWVSSYKYGDRVFNIIINATTGEVQGERPWSWFKIISLALAVIALFASVLFAFHYFQSR